MHDPRRWQSCEIRTCPEYEGRVCHNQGSCDPDGSKVPAGGYVSATERGACTCRWPFFGDSCQFSHCPSAIPLGVPGISAVTSGSKRDTKWLHALNYQARPTGHESLP